MNLKRLFIAFCLTFTVVSCSKNNDPDNPDTTPPVQGLELPDSSTVLTAAESVTIKGQGFAKDCEIVLRATGEEDIKATVTNVSSTSVEFTVPATVSGTYSIVLKQGGKEYTLGTLKFEVASQPETPTVIVIPDKYFRAYLLAAFDTDKNGKISEVEALAVTEIICDNLSIASLAGIEYFRNLTTLFCDRNELISIDLSKNKKLTMLDCSVNSLASLDISQNTILKELYCYDNQIQKLDVSKNLALTDLLCRINKIESLEVSKNTALTRLDCGDNKIPSLDVSKNTALTVFGCSGNLLTEIDISKNVLLEEFGCAENNISSIDLSHNPALIFIYCFDCNLSVLDVSANPLLRYLDCSGCNLSVLNVSANPALYFLDCSNNPGLNELKIKAGHRPERLNFEGTLIADESSITWVQ